MWSCLFRVQNAAARLVTGEYKCDHITPFLRDLHWLPVEARVQFKIILLVRKSLHGCAPDYIMLLFNVHCPAGNLHSSSRSPQELLSHPRTDFYGEQSFAHAAPKC